MTHESFTEQDAFDTSLKIQGHLGELKPKLLPPPRPTEQALSNVEQYFLEAQFLNDFFREFRQDFTIPEAAQEMIIKFNQWQKIVIDGNPVSEDITLHTIAQTALLKYFDLLERDPHEAKLWVKKLEVTNLASLFSFSIVTG